MSASMAYERLGMARYSLVRSGAAWILAILAVGLAPSACALQEAAFQHAWGTRMNIYGPIIRKYWEEHGQLPEKLEDTRSYGVPGGSAVLIQYKRVAEDQYMLSMRRSDVYLYG